MIPEFETIDRADSSDESSITDEEDLAKGLDEAVADNYRTSIVSSNRVVESEDSKESF